MKFKQTAVFALSLGGLIHLAHAEEVSQDFFPISLKNSSAQADAKGFVEDQSLSGFTRNWYAREHTTRGTRFTYSDSTGKRIPTHSRTNWVQSTVLNYSSGFTQGTVGFATEVAAYNAVALERDRQSVAGPRSNRTLTDSDGDVVGQWSKLGLANIKARVSNTTLTAGRQSMDTPMVATIGNRALPSSFEGISINSEEFDNLSFQGGTFDRVSPRTEQSLSKFRTEYTNNKAETDRVSTLGVNYQPFKSVKSSLFATNVEDFWNQYYLGITHEMGDTQVVDITTGLNYYKTKDAGSRKMGKIDNDTYSLSLTATHLAHSLTFAYQQVNGNEYFDYLHETNGIFLANSLFSDYNGPNEKSFQVAYGLNMAEYGVPGLKFSIYTARGWGIDGTHYQGTAYDVKNLDGDKHYEYGIGASYAVQSGPLKASSIRVNYTAHRATANQIDGSLDELRVVTTIPFNIL
ncbi:OprD family porin [Pseudomonas abieticivorans]|uniref:OprD family porin n=1 Tax=Pseudomonas abieticivorans TaxID=2931382 RepID=UPI0020BFEEA4|nr:OprD family porin [Pseudomonas sp. PIA16]